METSVVLDEDGYRGYINSGVVENNGEGSGASMRKEG